MSMATGRFLGLQGMTQYSWVGTKDSVSKQISKKEDMKLVGKLKCDSRVLGRLEGTVKGGNDQDILCCMRMSKNI